MEQVTYLEVIENAMIRHRVRTPVEDIALSLVRAIRDRRVPAECLRNEIDPAEWDELVHIGGDNNNETY